MNIHRNADLNTPEGALLFARGAYAAFKESDDDRDKCDAIFGARRAAQLRAAARCAAEGCRRKAEVLTSAGGLCEVCYRASEESVEDEGVHWSEWPGRWAGEERAHV